MTTMTIQQFNDLPLSQQIRAAAEDVRALEGDPDVQLDMAHWVRPIPRQPGRCAVCLAGSVLYRRFNTRSFVMGYNKLQPFMRALDDVRYGRLPGSSAYDDVRDAFCGLIDPPPDVDRYEDGECANDGGDYLPPYANLIAAADLLERNGL